MVTKLNTQKPIYNGWAWDQSFKIYLRGNELHLYWDDGEQSIQTIHPGDDPQDVATTWAEEIYATAPVAV